MSDFNSLINDEFGQCIFEEYAKFIKIYDYLLFWFAIEGFKRRFNDLARRSKTNDLSNHQDEISNMAKAIYNNFIKNNAKCKVYQWFSKSTREQIYNKIAKRKFDSKIFEDVKSEFEIKIQEEIYPKFLKSDIYQKYADNLKIGYIESKAKLSLNKNNPYYSSVTNYHTTSTQESECRYDPNESASTRLDDRKLVEKTDNPIKMQLTLNKVEEDKVIYDKAGKTDRTLQDLYAVGARSHLPNKPEDDPVKVRIFMEKLEKIYKEYRAYKDKKILKVIEKFEQNGEQDSSLRKLINKRETIQDSQSILDQHCKRVFNSNLHTKGPNSPGAEPLNSSKRILKPNGNQQENKNLAKQFKREQFKSPYFLNHHSSIIANNNNIPSINNKPSTITLMYQYSTDDYPFSMKIDKTAMTLKQFKKTILKKKINLSGQRLRYFFKKKDQIENMYIMEELTDNNEIVPLCDDRVFSRIEIVPI